MTVQSQHINDINRFLPDKIRAQQLYTHMKDRLVSSLLYVFEQVGEHADINKEDLISCLDSVERAKRVNPVLYGLYYDLLIAASQNSPAEITENFRCIVATDTPDMEDISILSFCPPDLDVKTIDLYRRSLDIETDSPFDFSSPCETSVQRCNELIVNALEVIKHAAPKLHAEISALITQIILSGSKPLNGADSYDGASSVYLWGAICINADSHHSLLHMIETLIHETAHSLLFGLSVDEPLVQNPPQLRYPSPLRKEPRPMDGVYHVTFVSARVHYGLSCVRNSELLDHTSMQNVEQRLSVHNEAFMDSITTVGREAMLSSLGESIMQNAKQYMTN